MVEHFPRVDPVVIMLPLRGDQCLLGRQAVWPKGRMAPLAGFVEPGESIEEACAREVKEEAGMSAVRVTYHASQPWPFPSSLMFGLFVEVEGDAVPDGVELEEVRWLTREEARAMLDGRHPDLLAPNRYAIAHALLTHWVDQTRTSSTDQGSKMRDRYSSEVT
jgi:NAD+ diphosphatase